MFPLISFSAPSSDKFLQSVWISQTRRLGYSTLLSYISLSSGLWNIAHGGNPIYGGVDCKWSRRGQFGPFFCVQNICVYNIDFLKSNANAINVCLQPIDIGLDLTYKIDPRQPSHLDHCNWIDFRHYTWYSIKTGYDTMWGLVMKPFPKRYQKSDALQVQLCWVGSRRSERWDP